jgi:hypothetical protein
MTIALDHVFIFCDECGPEAESLLGIGLIEGSRNVHPGQGTSNRRFFFRGGFLELLWVSNPEEAQSSLTAPTKLWPRWAARKQGACPFGMPSALPQQRFQSPHSVPGSIGRDIYRQRRAFCLPSTPHCSNQNFSTWVGPILQRLRQVSQRSTRTVSYVCSLLPLAFQQVLRFQRRR